MKPIEAATLLVAARTNGVAIDWTGMVPATRDDAYAIQDATVLALGPVAGWKVGARSEAAEPICAPLPASGLLASGARLLGPTWALRGIEVEVALRVGRDLDIGQDVLTPAELVSAFDAAMPAIEVVETRLDRWKESPALAQLADLQSHGALVLGAPSRLEVSMVDLLEVEAQLRMGAAPVTSTKGGNPGRDIWRLLGWLACHCARRRRPLRAGQVVTTGSCTGMAFANQGDEVQGSITGLGQVHLGF